MCIYVRLIRHGIRWRCELYHSKVIVGPTSLIISWKGIPKHRGNLKEIAAQHSTLA